MVFGYEYTECPVCHRKAWKPRKVELRSKGRSYAYLQFRHPKDGRSTKKAGPVHYQRIQEPAKPAKPASKPKPSTVKPDLEKLASQLELVKSKDPDDLEKAVAWVEAKRSKKNE